MILAVLCLETPKQNENKSDLSFFSQFHHTATATYATEIMYVKEQFISC